MFKRDFKLLEELKEKYIKIKPFLNEQARRIWAANEARMLGKSGPELVSEAIGIARSTVFIGLADLERAPVVTDNESSSQYIRKPGGGRKKIVEKDPQLIKDLQFLVDSTTRGDPESPLLWTSKSTTKLCKELKNMGHDISPRSVYTLLGDIGYSLQSNRKTKEGKGSPDRNAQFELITSAVIEFQKKGLPVISVDAKKKELIGNFENQGREWSAQGKPTEVNIHDFPDPLLGKTTPYGIYDISANKGWVIVLFT